VTSSDSIMCEIIIVGSSIIIGKGKGKGDV